MTHPRSPSQIPLPLSRSSSYPSSVTQSPLRTTQTLPGEDGPGQVPRPKVRRGSTLGLLSRVVGDQEEVKDAGVGEVEETVDTEAREEELMKDDFKKSHTIRFNQPVGSMSISPSNRDIALASRKGLYILDVANLHQAPRFIPQGGKWHPADCQWSPHPSHSHLILTTSSQKLLVWDLLHPLPSPTSPTPSSSSSSLQLSISAHFRAITDINWHARDPNLVATTGIDGGVNCFDLRSRLSFSSSNNPTFGNNGGGGREGGGNGTGDGVVRLAAWGAAGTQVKWNRWHDHVLASGHEGEVRIWDTRKGSLPITVIKAHTSRIYGIDWDRRTRHQIVTCSLDKTIKRFSIPSLSLSSTLFHHNPYFPSLLAPTTPDFVIHTSSPVWRARNLPFGRGILSLPGTGGASGGMEMWGLFDHQGGMLGDGEGKGRLVKRWADHKEGVKEFVWRSRGGGDAGFDDREFQLISWGQDRLLKIRPVDLDVLERVGYKRGAKIDSLVSRRGAKDISYARLPQPTDTTPPTIDIQTPGLSILTDSSRAFNLPPPISRIGSTMTRGATGRTKTRQGEDQLNWMINVREEHAKDYSTSSSREESGANSRLGSVSRAASRSRERSRDRGSVSVGSGRRGSGGLGSVGGEERAGIDLQDEIRRVTQTFPKVKFENLEVVKRRYTVSLNGPWAEGSRLAFIRVQFSFPPQYPYSPSKEHIPSLELQTPPSVSEATKIIMLQRLQNIRETHRPCLSACIAYLLGYQERRGRATFGVDDSDSDEERVLVQAPIKNPRTCGASFGPNGELVCFFKSGNMQTKRRVASDSRSPSSAMVSIPAEALKPRQNASLTNAMSALSKMADQVSGDGGRSRFQRAALLFPESFNLARQGTRSRSAHRKQDRNRLGIFQRPSSSVVIRDFSSLQPLDRDAGALYHMYGESDACTKNEKTALSLGNDAHAEIWRMMATLLSPHRRPVSKTDQGPPPPTFKRKRVGVVINPPAQGLQTAQIVIHALFEGLAEARDVQMLSLLSRFLADHEQSQTSAQTDAQATTKATIKPDYFASRSTSRAISLREDASNTPRAESPSSPIPFGLSFSSYRHSSWSLAASNRSSSGFFGQRDRQDSDISLYRPGNSEDMVTPSIAMPPGFRQPSFRSASPRDRERPTSLLASTPSGSLSPTMFVSAPGKTSLTEVTGLSSSSGSKQHRVSFGPESLSPRGVKRLDPPITGRGIRGRSRTHTQPWGVKVGAPTSAYIRTSTLEQAKQSIYECWRNAHGEILAAWEYYPQRAEILQRSFLQDSDDPTPVRGRMASGLVIAHRKCKSCGKLVKGQEPECSECRNTRERQPCSVCRLPIAALCLTCSLCQHRTHSDCIETLLDRLSGGTYFCGFGCGCSCLEGGFAGLAHAIPASVYDSPAPSVGGNRDRRVRQPATDSDSASIMTAVLAREGRRQTLDAKATEDPSTSRTGLLARAGIRNLTGDRFSNFLGGI